MTKSISLNEEFLILATCPKGISTVPWDGFKSHHHTLLHLAGYTNLKSLHGGQNEDLDITYDNFNLTGHLQCTQY